MQVNVLNMFCYSWPMGSSKLCYHYNLFHMYLLMSFILDASFIIPALTIKIKLTIEMTVSHGFQDAFKIQVLYHVYRGKVVF